MYGAIDKGHYDVSSYAIMKDDEEAYNQTLAQEFAYWLIMANLVIPYSCGKSYHSFAPSSDVIVILRCSVDVTSEDSDSN